MTNDEPLSNGLVSVPMRRILPVYARTSGVRGELVGVTEMDMSTLSVTLDPGQNRKLLCWKRLGFLWELKVLFSR